VILVVILIMLLHHTYRITGWAITILVRNSLEEWTVDFSQRCGRAIGENYMSMTLDSINADESTHSTAGILPATQSTQPALSLMEKPPFEDMRPSDLILGGSAFA